jgi:Gti1/Pac2 family transcription factor
MTIDDIPKLVSVRRQVPEGRYQPARCSKSRQRAESEQEDPKTGGALIDFPVSCTQPYRANPSPAVSTPRDILPAVPPELAKPPPLTGLTLPKAPPVPRRDPNWVMNNYVLVCADVYQVQNRKLFSPESSKDMAPLVYMRCSPYQPRHPADNDAIRALDSVS